MVAAIVICLAVVTAMTAFDYLHRVGRKATRPGAGSGSDGVQPWPDHPGDGGDAGDGGGGGGGGGD